MFGVTIREMDENGGLVIDLRDVLALLGTAATSSRWTIEGVEATGTSAAERLERLSDAAATVSGNELMQIASEVSQIVDGKFSAFEDNSDSPWIVIAAVDSSAYDVITSRSDVLDTIKNAFKSAEYIPGMEPR